MTAFNELHPVVQERINDYPTADNGDPWCGCTFGESPHYGKDVQLCRFHMGMLIGVDEALEWVEREEQR